MQWMKCTTCGNVVMQNPIGVCLGCQSGFDKEMDDDQHDKLKNLMVNHDYWDREDHDQFTLGLKNEKKRKKN